MQSCELVISISSLACCIAEGKSADEIKAMWKDDVEKFKVQRKPYLLYAVRRRIQKSKSMLQ